MWEAGGQYFHYISQQGRGTHGPELMQQRKPTQPEQRKNPPNLVMKSSTSGWKGIADNFKIQKKKYIAYQSRVT
jgi:hypothetical protein